MGSAGSAVMTGRVVMTVCSAIVVATVSVVGCSDVVLLDITDRFKSVSLEDVMLAIMPIPSSTAKATAEKNAICFTVPPFLDVPILLEKASSGLVDPGF